MIGSNLFNMAIIPIDDLLYAPGPLLNAVSANHLLTAGAVILMTGVFIAGLHFKPKRHFRVSWCSLTLIVLFLAQAYLSYTLA
jgi:cation:H+ antiporter